MKEYYYLKDSTPVGPFSLEELHALHLAEKITLDTMVSKVGATEWLQYAVLVPKDTGSNLPPVPSAAPAPAPEPVDAFSVAEAGCPHCFADLPISQKREVPHVCPKCFSDIHSKEKSLWGYFIYAFSQYATFKGRATRTEFWSFILFTIIFSIVIAGVGIVIPFVSLTFELIIFLPSLAVLFRRFHDVNLSGWWVILIKTVPIITLTAAFIHFIRTATIIGGDMEKLADVLFVPTQAVPTHAMTEAPQVTNGYEMDGEALVEILTQAWMQTWGMITICAIIIPLACAIFGFVVCVTDSKRGVNKYGVSTKYPIA